MKYARGFKLATVQVQTYSNFFCCLYIFFVELFAQVSLNWTTSVRTHAKKCRHDLLSLSPLFVNRDKPQRDPLSLSMTNDENKIRSRQRSRLKAPRIGNHHAPNLFFLQKKTIDKTAAK